MHSIENHTNERVTNDLDHTLAGGNVHMVHLPSIEGHSEDSNGEER